jgi:hypothetical protein
MTQLDFQLQSLITTEISSSNDEDKNREDAVSEEDADSS